MKRFCEYVIGAVLTCALGGMTACASLFPATPGDTRSQAQITFDDACWVKDTAEAAFLSYQKNNGAVAPAILAQYQTASVALDTACSGPLPTDTKQFYSKVVVEAAGILAMITSKPQS